MFHKQIDITLLCKVVDNFGDIGVVYRLANALSAVCSDKKNGFPGLSIRIIADNLNSFALLAPGIKENPASQTFNGWKILQWNAQKECLDEFKKKPPQIIIECFQCGRPDWLDHLLFDIKVPDIVNIIMLDYLTAEDYAETFHCLKSLTRSARVRKVNFMPGFTPKTGGLILDKPLFQAEKRSAEESVTDKPFNIVFFSYPRNQTPVLRALHTFAQFIQHKDKTKLNILLAKGAGFSSFKEAYLSGYRIKTDADGTEDINTESFSLTELPFLPQQEWDKLLYETPVLFIRGEDSLSRACLSGRPFVWHAYPQSEDYQLIKVQALLEKLRPHFSEKNFVVIEKCWQIYNGKPGNLENAVADFLLISDELREGFGSFSRTLKNNGDLAVHLLEFIKDSAMLNTVRK